MKFTCICQEVGCHDPISVFEALEGASYGDEGSADDCCFEG